LNTTTHNLTGALGTISYLLVATAGLAGLLGTLAWWRLADQT
jgi:hypothetical protein